jgi:hypothetical protein
MKLPSRFVVIACAILVMGGCSHGTVADVPTGPSVVPPVTVKRLMITPVGGGVMIAGGVIDIMSEGPLPAGPTVGALAEFTDGSGHYIPATWSSSDASVLVVSNNSLRAIGRGTAILTASAQGHTATETFKVEPGIPGTWVGTYVVDDCAAGSGSMQELICSTIPGRPRGALAVGTVAPITLDIRQSGTDLTATAAFADVRGTLTGTDRGQNVLTFDGTLTANGRTATIYYWDGRVVTDVMEGFVGLEVRIAGVPSHAQVVGHFVDLTRR